jgi:site-specific DNA recombinase
MEMRLVDERTANSDPDPTLVRLLTRAWTIRSEILKGDGRSLYAIAQAHGIGDSYLGRLLRLSFLAPDIVEAILQGKQPSEVTANRLTTMPKIPADWAEQRDVILGTSQRH